ncbi:MAG: Thiol:disulfide interchange protein [Verrucomicrobiaceae bacterium]|nr:Thiol:disulfide interchange protein [Verrucomicrobiaceae bacterium]
MILDSLAVNPSDFEQRTGWALKPQGACKGEACVPMPATARNSDGTLNIEVVADRLGMPLIRCADDKHWAIGPEAGINGRALTTAQAPRLVLPDLNGNLFDIASLRGKKVLLTTWASWCGCRLDGAIWAELRERFYPQGLEIVTIAMDTGGAEAARPWLEMAKPKHPALIDAAHSVGELFGVVNVPNGIWIDEQGMIVRPAEPSWPGRTPVTDMKPADIAQAGMSQDVEATQLALLDEVGKMLFETDLYLEMLEDWVKNGANSRYVLSPEEVIERSQPRSPDIASAAAHFELGEFLHRNGQHELAVQHWREAHRLQPLNWTYKRQAWNIEDPMTQSAPTVYDGTMLSEVRKYGAENYYPKIVV